MLSPLSLLAVAALANLALARTDLSGCTSSETVINWGASYIYWVPGTGEICSLIDCGGGRAPPATTKPGCPQYKGTATYSPDYLPGYNGGGGIPASTTSVASLNTSQSSALITGSSTTSTAISQQTSSNSVIDSVSSSSVSSAVFTTSLSGTATPSTSQAVSSSANGGQSSSRTRSSTSSSSAAASTVAGNSGAKTRTGYGFVGAVAAGFAVLL